MIRLKYLSVLIVFSAAVFVGCNSKTPDYKKKLFVDTESVKGLSFDRYEDVLFHLDTADFQKELKTIQQQYRPFLEGDLDNPQAVAYLKKFAVDPFSLDLYQKVKQKYPNLNEVKGIIEGVYRHFHYYYPEVILPSRIFTCVSGIDPEMPPILCFDDALVISLDWYLNNDVVYEQLGIPQYRARRTSVEYIARDVAQQLYESYLYRDVKQNSLIEEMIEAGRKDFFIEAMCPEMADSVLLGYSSSQMQWVEGNEGVLWADMVGGQYLYSTDLEVYRTFLLDGPFTNEYSHEAPPRIGEFIGLHIVRSYMSLHDLSLQELMRNDDFQGLFLDSHYKPKK